MAITDRGDLFREVYRLFEGLRFAAESDYYLRLMLAEIGWDPAALDAATPGIDPLAILETNLAAFVASLESLGQALDGATGSYEDVFAILMAARRVAGAIDDVHEGVLGTVELSPPGAFVESIATDLRAWLLTAYLQARFPELFRLAGLLGVIHDRVPAPEVRGPGGALVRQAASWPVLDWARLQRLVTDPRALFAEICAGEDGIDRLFSAIAAVASTFGIRSVYGLRQDAGPAADQGRDLAARMLTLFLGEDAAGEPFGLTLAWSPADRGDLGLVLVPFGPLDASSVDLVNWTVDTTVQPGTVESLAIGDSGVVVLPDGAAPLTAGFAATRKRAGTAPAVLVGDLDGSHLKVDGVRLSGAVTDGGGSPQVTLGFALEGGALVVESLFSLAWQDLAVGYDVLAGEMRLDLIGLSLSIAQAGDLFDVELDASLVFEDGVLSAASTVELRQPSLGALPIGTSSLLNLVGRLVRIEEDAVVLALGESVFSLGDDHRVGWEALELRLTQDRRVQVAATGLSLESSTVPGLSLALDAALAFQAGAFVASDSSLALRRPAATDFGLGDLRRNDTGGYTLALARRDPFGLGGLRAGWQALAVDWRAGATPALRVDLSRLVLGTGPAPAVDADVCLEFSAAGADLCNLEVHKPDLGSLAPDFHLTEEVLALRWTTGDLDRLLRAFGSSLGDATGGAAGGATITLRVLFGDDYADLEEVRLDWASDTSRVLGLPGLQVALPADTMFSLLLGGGNGDGRDLADLAVVSTLPQGEPLTVSSSFAWERRPAPGSQDRERELLNERDNPEPAFELALTPREPASLVLVDLGGGNGSGLPRFFRQLEQGLSPLDFDDEGSLLAPVQFRAGGLQADDWDAEFTVTKDLPFPFLNEPGKGQLIEIRDPETEVDLPNDRVSLLLTAAVRIGSLEFATRFGIHLNLDTFALSVEHEDDGLALTSDQPELTGHYLGLDWTFTGRQVAGDLYEYFKLFTRNYNYRVKQVDGCRLELAYGKMGKEPVTFTVENFELGEEGISLRAAVTDKPARLNGLDTRFRFQDSGFEIVENEIQSFTLAGSGPLPPDLVGDATADIALQFEQRDGNLQLVAGGAELKGTKMLDCKASRFRFSVDALGLKFVDDGGFHLYFTVTGSAEFSPAPSDDKNGPLALLSLIKIELVDAPLSGDMSVLAKHIRFLVELPKPISFGFLGTFEMEVRGIGFYPQAEVFGGDPAMLVTGQVKFAQGGGDAANSEVDYHRLFIGLPEPGKFVPRVYMSDLPLALNVGEAFRLNGSVSFVDDKTMTGFSGEGTLQIQGLPTIAAAFSFLRVRRDEQSPWLRAWFIYLEVRQVSFAVPTVQLFIREVGLGFGYRYTLVSIKAADEANDLKELIGELRELSRTQANLATIGSWAVDLEDPGEAPRWTVVLRALFAQSSAAASPLDWKEEKESKLPNMYLFDAVVALRSDLTFLMAVRGWINTNYYDFVTGDDIRSRPLFSGYVLLSPRQKRLLAHLASNPDGHTGSNPPLPDIVQKALTNGQFSATLLVEPGLVHQELGWPNQLRWSGDIGPLQVEFRGGFLLRLSTSEIVMGQSFLARGRLEVGASVDLVFVGAEFRATADVAFGARYIGVIPFDVPANFAFYGAVGVEAHLDFTLSFWIGLCIKIFGARKCWRKTFRFSASVDFTASLEVGIVSGGPGLRGQGTLAASAMGHRLEFSVRLGIAKDNVALAQERTERFLQVGLEATEVEALPGVPRSRGATLLDARRVSPAGTGAGGLAFDATAPEPAFHPPEYILFVMRYPADARDGQEDGHPARGYFLLLPRGEEEQGFLPVPPGEGIVPEADFTLKVPAGDARLVHWHPGAGDWRPVEPDAQGAYTWQVAWDAVVEEVEGEPVHLRDYLLQAFVTEVVDAETEQERDRAVGDPELPRWARSKDVEDERVQNPAEGAYEAAVRGAVAQFRGSPFFKRDENYGYDRLLGAAFREDTSIYRAGGNGAGPGGGEEEAALQNQRARQLRGTIVQDIIADLRDYAAGDDAHVSRSVAFQMGLVFRVEVAEDDDGEPEWPAWLQMFVEPAEGAGGEPSDELPWIRQRFRPEHAAPPADAALQPVRPFNIAEANFGTRPPQFDRVQHYTTANTIAITWDLTWPAPPTGRCTAAQAEPEQHLVHYHVRRRSLDGEEAEQVRTITPVRVLHREEDGVLIGIRPRFQIVDHFHHESLDEQAALPATGRSYLYTITPVDFEGNGGRPLTLVATRYPDEPPPVPADARLLVRYQLDDEAMADHDLVAAGEQEEVATVPLVSADAIALSAGWTEPPLVREGPQVPVARYYLVFRRMDTLPIGSYGLDSTTQAPPASALPSSSAMPRRGDVRVQVSPTGPRHARRALIDAAQLLATVEHGEGVRPADGMWRPEAWRVFIQTESVGGVPSALAPVELVLRASTPAGGDLYEERQVAELEWLPRPVRLPLLPAEDGFVQAADAHFPMPAVGAARFGERLDNVAYQPHPFGIRTVRFLWNQGGGGYPLDLNAGYQLLLLDVDAHTTGTFGDPARLAAALRPVQEVQMVPPGDLPLTPGDTLASSQWEAWYPSAMRRLAERQAAAVAGSRTPFSPWYSWRDSILVWPAWPGLTDGPGERDRALHPLLDRLVGRLQEPPQGDRPPYNVEVQVSPPLRPVRLAGFLKSTGPKSDPYGWGITQRLGLSVTLTLRDAGTNRVLGQDEMLSAVNGVLEELQGVDELKPYLPHLFVELLFQPGESVSLKPGEVTAGGDKLLAMIQLSLRPTIEQVQVYRRMHLRGPSGTRLELRFPARDTARSLIVQAEPAPDADRSSRAEVRTGQIELDAGRVIDRAVTLPLAGETSVLLRGSEGALDAGIEVWFKVAEPLRADELNKPDVRAVFDRFFVQGADDRSGYLRIEPRPAAIPAADLALLEPVFAEVDRVVLAVVPGPLAPIPVTDERTTYFTVPDTLSAAFAGDGLEAAQWQRLARYLAALNSPDAGDDQIELPIDAPGIEEVLPDVLSWAQRFFDHAGDVLAGGEGDEGQPWLATAYPRAASPAYASPDPGGRLRYDHLLEDRWAHNYRYYVQPYGRYDRLWRSFWQSSRLFPENGGGREDALARAQLSAAATPDPAAGGLDLVLDRTYPVDRPLVLAAGRLDPPTPGGATIPGRTWEVIVARHWEQALIERNQTLARQLSFRQVAFTLLRRFTDTGWLRALHALHERAEAPPLDFSYVADYYPGLPGAYEAPQPVEIEAAAPGQALDLALPTRLERFQQGALVLQWDGLPYYYEHNLVLVAQTTSQVSPTTRILQRDFAYASPAPFVEAEGVSGEEGAAARALRLHLASYWDCLPEDARAQWPSEAPVAADGKRSLSGLPDPAVVYQLVETFAGNIEVQFEFYFDADAGRFLSRRLGSRYAAIAPDDIHFVVPADAGSRYALEFTVAPAADREIQPASNQVVISADSAAALRDALPDSLAGRLSVISSAGEAPGTAEWRLVLDGFMTRQEAIDLASLVVLPEDVGQVEALFRASVQRGQAGAELKVRARRGTAAPGSLAALDVTPLDEVAGP